VQFEVVDDGFSTNNIGQEDYSEALKRIEAEKHEAATPSAPMAAAPTQVSAQTAKKTKTKRGVSVGAIIAILLSLAVIAGTVIGFFVKLDDVSAVVEGKAPATVVMDFLDEVVGKENLEKFDFSAMSKEGSAWAKDSAKDRIKQWDVYVPIGFILGTLFAFIALICALCSIKGKGVNAGFLVFAILTFLSIGGMLLGLYLMVEGSVLLMGVATFAGITLVMLLVGIFGYASRKKYLNTVGR